MMEGGSRDNMYGLTRKEGCRVGGNQPCMSQRVSQRMTKGGA